jgi:hypothetical protein
MLQEHGWSSGPRDVPKLFVYRSSRLSMPITCVLVPKGTSLPRVTKLQSPMLAADLPRSSLARLSPDPVPACMRRSPYLVILFMLGGLMLFWRLIKRLKCADKEHLRELSNGISASFGSRHRNPFGCDVAAPHSGLPRRATGGVIDSGKHHSGAQKKMPVLTPELVM